jgi:hypothetical protein
MIAIINLLTNIFITGTSIIGCATIINKVGKFFKIIEENKDDGFKLAFDNVMMESIDDMNKCVESMSTIASNINHIIFIFYDISVGNKFIRKNKDGKIIICGKTKIHSGYKDKIDELKNRVKKYEEELKKIKHKPTDEASVNNTSSDNSTNSVISDDDFSMESENSKE